MPGDRKFSTKLRWNTPAGGYSPEVRASCVAAGSGVKRFRVMPCMFPSYTHKGSGKENRGSVKGGGRKRDRQKDRETDRETERATWGALPPPPRPVLSAGCARVGWGERCVVFWKERGRPWRGRN